MPMGVNGVLVCNNSHLREILKFLFSFMFLKGVTMFGLCRYSCLHAKPTTSWCKETDTIYKSIVKEHRSIVKCGCDVCCHWKFAWRDSDAKSDKKWRKKPKGYKPNHTSAETGYQFDEFVWFDELKNAISGLLREEEFCSLLIFCFLGCFNNYYWLLLTLYRSLS